MAKFRTSKYLRQPPPNHEFAVPAPQVMPQSQIITIASQPICRPFEKLPSELGDMIWSWAFKDPRIISIYQVKDQNGLQILRAYYQYPKLFHICRQSRRFAQERYDFIFEDQLGTPIPFDFDNDALSLPDANVARLMKLDTGPSDWGWDNKKRRDEVAKLQHIIIGEECRDDRVTATKICEIPALRQLTLRIPRGTEDEFLGWQISSKKDLQAVGSVTSGGDDLKLSPLRISAIFREVSGTCSGSVLDFWDIVLGVDLHNWDAYLADIPGIDQILPGQQPLLEHIWDESPRRITPFDSPSSLSGIYSEFISLEM